MHLRRVSFLLLLAAPAYPFQERPPNILYVLADDLGWGELGCYGQTKIRTPNVDRLAREGLRFTRHYCGSPNCAPSRCVLLTGLHTGHSVVRNNWENGGWGEDVPEGQYPLPEGTRTLARDLHEAGYATAAIGKWGLGGPETSGAPNRQGFDLFLGYLCQRKAHNYYPTHLWRNEEKLVLEGNDFFSAHQRIEAPLESEDEYWERFTAAQYAPDLMIEEALDFVRANREHPFFLYFASTIPHVSLQVPPEDLDAYPREWDEAPYLGDKGYLPHPRPRAAYAAMVTRLDRDVGRIMALLDELDLADDTVVMFSSDNGPTFNGGSDSEFFDSAAGMNGLKTMLLEGGIKVPFVVRWPGHVAPESVSDHLSAFQDVMPTLLDIAGVEKGDGLDGISFLPTLLGEDGQAQHPFLYWEMGTWQAVQAGRWKALRRGLKKGDLTTELYDLESDPAESKDVAEENPEVVARLERILREEHVPSEPFPIPALDGKETEAQ